MKDLAIERGVGNAMGRKKVCGSGSEECESKCVNTDTDTAFSVVLRRTRKVDFNRLLVFFAVYRMNSLTKAASVIGVSQPAISNVLAELRELFEDRLFVRNGRCITPTPKATQLAELISSALSPLADVLDLTKKE